MKRTSLKMRTTRSRDVIVFAETLDDLKSKLSVELWCRHHLTQIHFIPHETMTALALVFTSERRGKPATIKSLARKRNKPGTFGPMITDQGMVIKDGKATSTRIFRVPMSLEEYLQIELLVHHRDQGDSL